MHRPSHQSRFWAGGHRVTCKRMRNEMPRTPASLRVFVHTPLLASAQNILETSSTQHVIIAQLALEYTRICMFGGCYVARSPLIFSDRRSRDSGWLLFDHRVGNEDEKPQVLLRSTASSATSVMVRVCMRTCVNGKENTCLYSANQQLCQRIKRMRKNAASPIWKLCGIRLMVLISQLAN